MKVRLIYSPPNHRLKFLDRLLPANMLKLILLIHKIQITIRISRAFKMMILKFVKIQIHLLGKIHIKIHRRLMLQKTLPK